MKRTIYRTIAMDKGTVVHGNWEEDKNLSKPGLLGFEVLTYDVLPEKKSANHVKTYEDKDGKTLTRSVA